MSANSAQDTRPARRPGVAVLWVLFLLTLISAVMGLTLKDFYANRSFLDQRQKRLQADWLARAGIELATARLLKSDKAIKMDVTDLVANSLVHIEVVAAPGSKDSFALTSDARFPINDAHPVIRTQGRRMKRVVNKEGIRLEAVKETGITPGG
jgi:hypothetical protein